MNSRVSMNIENANIVVIDPKDRMHICSVCERIEKQKQQQKTTSQMIHNKVNGFLAKSSAQNVANKQNDWPINLSQISFILCICIFHAKMACCLFHSSIYSFLFAKVTKTLQNNNRL